MKCTRCLADKAKFGFVYRTKSQGKQSLILCNGCMSWALYIVFIEDTKMFFKLLDKASEVHKYLKSKRI